MPRISEDVLMGVAEDVIALGQDPEEFAAAKVMLGAWNQTDAKNFAVVFRQTRSDPAKVTEALRSGAEMAEAVASHQEAGRLARELPENPVLRSLQVGASNAVQDIGGLGARIVGADETADSLHRQANILSMGADVADEDSAIPAWLLRGGRGATRSLSTALVSAPLGGWGVIGSFAAIRGNQAISEADDAGLKGRDKWGYVGRAAAIEGGIAGAFQAVGFGGLEKMMGGRHAITKATIREVFKATGKSLLQELPEEIITEIADNYNQALSGVSPDATTPDNLARTFLDTVTQTVMAVGFGGVVRAPADLATAKERDAAIQAVASSFGVDEELARKAWGRATEEAARVPKAEQDTTFEQALGREILEEVALSDQGLEAWAKLDPESAGSLAQIEQPSRREWEEAGLPRRPAEVRAQITAKLRDILAGQDEDTEATEQEEEEPATEEPPSPPESVPVPAPEPKAEETEADIDEDLDEEEATVLAWPEDDGKEHTIGEFAIMVKGRTEGNKLYMEWANVTPAERAALEEATGLDLSRIRTHSIDESGVRHIHRRHGDGNEHHDTRPITDADFDLIPEIVANPDKVSYGGKAKGTDLDVVVYEKQLDGKFYYLEEVRKGRGKLTAKSLYVEEPSPAARPASPEGAVAHTSETYPGTRLQENIAEGQEESKGGEAVDPGPQDLTETTAAHDIEKDQGARDESDTGGDQKTGGPKADAPSGEGDASGGIAVEEDTSGAPGPAESNEGNDSIRGPAEPDGGGSVSEDGVSTPAVGVEGQQATGDAGDGVPGPESGGHGVVPEASGRDNDDATGAEPPVVGIVTAPNGNLDLRKAEPVRLTKGERRKANSRAIEVLDNKGVEGLSDADRDALRQYTGKGGLESGTKESLNQHYTDYLTIRAIFRALRKAGVRLETLLEPGVGAGNFVGHVPEANWTTVDLDETNHRVVSALYPSGTHYNMSFEDFTASGFDAVVSNVPFLETRGAGRRKARPDIEALHDFYFAHALDLVRDDGVVAFVTSTGTMDKGSEKVRREIVDKADVLAAYRLPAGHFMPNAHTKVITDIIFLHKRPKGVTPNAATVARNELFVLSTETVDGVALSEWYQAHPDAVLGELVFGKNEQYGGRPAYEVHGEADLSQVSIHYRPYGPQDNHDSNESGDGTPKTYADFVPWAAERGIPTKISSDGDYAQNIIIRDGEIWVKDGEIDFEDVQWTGKTYTKSKGATAAKILSLDAIAKKVAEFQNGDESAAGEALASIEDYRGEHSKPPHTDRALRKFFRDNDEMTYYAELTAAFDREWNPSEALLAKTKYEGGGKILATRSEDLRTRAVASEDGQGRISFPATDELVSQNDIEALLGSGYALAGAQSIQNDILYYSGNIYQKLEDIAAMRRRVGFELTPYLDKQEAKLREILPEPKTLAEMNIKGSESWLVPHLKGVNLGITSSIDDATGMRKYEVISGWRPGDLNAEEAKVLERHLNNFALVTRRNQDGIQESMGSYMRRMREAEADLKSALIKMKEAIGRDEGRVQAVEHAYNSRFRNYVKPDYEQAQYLIQDVLDEIAEGAPKVRDAKTGKLRPLALRKNQVAWVMQALYEGRGINAHDVGGGKTMAAIVLARAMKRRGRAQKPMLVVPAKTIKKWVRETKLLFPQANVVDLGNLSKDKRSQALFDLANSNADYIYISHEGFGQIKLPVDQEIRYVQDAINEHVDDPEASGRQEALIAQKAEDYMDALLNDGRDTRLTWDKLGIDCLIADEAHAFKNLGINNQLVRFGLGVAFGFGKSGNIKSARSYDFRFKANYTAERNNGGNVFLLTATPTPNKPMEIYTMLRHFGPDVFAEYGIGNDRDFASQFFLLGTVNDPTKNKPKQILKAIVNAQELRGLLNRYVDKMNMEDMPWIQTPDSQENRILLDQSAAYAIVAEDLILRQKNLDPHPTEGSDTLVAIYTGGRSASIDPRLYGGDHAGVEIDARSFDSADDKVQHTIDGVAANLKQNPAGGQLIFVDDSGHTQVDRGVMAENLHREIKAELIARGIPKEQIAIINGKEITNPKTKRESSPGAKADARKAELQDEYNAGRIKVVIGSTTSMGEGMDLQVTTTDIWHMDIPYTPGAIRQRNGRGVRPGNANDTVKIHYLLMRGSFDSMSLNLVQTKTGWNEAIWDKDVSDTISTEEEMTAGSIPSSKQILIELEKDPVRRKQLEVDYQLESMHSQVGFWRDEHYAIGTRITAKTRQMDSLRRSLAERESKLAEVAPDERIKNDEKRAEQFEKSKAYVQRMIETTQRHIARTQEEIGGMREQQAELATQLAALQEDIRKFEERWFDEAGESKVTAADIGEETGGHGELGFGKSRGEKRKKRQIGKRRQDGAEVANTGPVQSAEVIGLIHKLWPGLALRGPVTFKHQALGWYTPDLGEVRLKDVRDVVVAMHEIGHHFDRELDWWSKKNGAPRGIRDELLRLGHDLYGGTKPNGGYKAEGFAEFIREYLTGGEIKDRAPNLYRWFTTVYLVENPGEAAKLRQLEDAVTRYQMQTPEQAVRAFRQPIHQDWSSERIAAAVIAAEASHRDANLPILRAMQETGADLDQLRPSDNPYMLLTAHSRSAGGRALHSVLNETIDLRGQRNGEGLRAVLAPVTELGKERVEEWIDYAIARRALELDVRGINSGIDPSDASAVVAKYESEIFDDALVKVTEWSRRQLHLLVESGAMTDSEFEQIEKLNPVYVPFSRQFADGELKSGRKGSGRGVYRIKGSGREIHNPIDALIMQSEKITQTAMQADVIRALVKFYDQQRGKAKSLGLMMSEIPAPQEATTFTAEQIKRDMARKAVELGANPDEVAAAMLDTWTERLTVYLPANEFKGKENVVSVVVNGKRRFFELKADLVPIVEGMAKEGVLPGKLGEISRRVVGLQRLGATGLNPAFGLLRNPLRDTLTAALTAEYHFHFPVVSTIVGSLMDIANTEEAQMYHALGLDIAGRVGQDMQAARRAAKRATATTRMERLRTMGFISGLREILSHSEVGPRLMEFRGAYKYALDKWGRSGDAAVLASCAAKDVTVNFSRAGTTARAINEVVLFYNAAIQSVDKLARSMGILEAAPWAKDKSRSGNAMRTVAKGAAFITAAALMNYLRNRDEEWWKELPPHEKWGYIHIKIPFTKTVARIPLPFEAGAVFGALPVAMLENARTPGSFREALSLSLDGASPIGFGSWHQLARNIAMVSPIADILANEDWKGSDIVPNNIARSRVPADQFGPRTSWLAKLIGSHVPGGYSPAKIDHLLNGYTGNLYRRTMSAIETAMDPSAVGVDGDMSTVPVFGTLFLRPGTSRVISDFYDRIEELRRKKGSGKASVSEVGELAIMERASRGLQEVWLSRRKAVASGNNARTVKEQSDALLASVQDRIRLHNKRDKADDRVEGLGNLLYAYTSPGADQVHKDKIVEMLGEMNRDEAVAALRREVRRRGMRLKTRTATGKLTAFGKRLARLRQLMDR